CGRDDNGVIIDYW
nr:immunoglobulin heavy chain junction region [Macaca mulatta]MOX58587.1 immunoglobulin heavy chain junction region [Macaca mulatta]MOX58676.1 immunoglobulin heavy chain junction region [Macaca mulatta]MOX58960.1 immunoglobulin heavy chain junction region [Macaca mulatta]MOX58999.1 immunoglobulin heavy chain junction region [Macaca mulatta]